MKHIDFLDFRGLRCVQRHTHFPWTVFAAIRPMHIFLHANGVELVDSDIEVLKSYAEFEEINLIDGELERLRAIKDRYSSSFIAIACSHEPTLDLQCGVDCICWTGMEKIMPVVEVPLTLVLPQILDSSSVALMLADILMKCTCVKALHGSAALVNMNYEEKKQINEKATTWSDRARAHLLKAFQKQNKNIKEFVDICVPGDIALFLVEDAMLSPRSIRYNDWDNMTYQNAQTFLCAAPAIFLDNLEVPRFSDEDEEDIELWKNMVGQFKWLSYFLMPSGSKWHHLEEFINELKYGPLKVFGISRMRESTLLFSLVDACLCRAEVLEIADVLAVSFSQFKTFFCAQVESRHHISNQVKKMIRMGVKTLMVSMDCDQSFSKNDFTMYELEVRFFSSWGDDLKLRGSLGL